MRQHFALLGLALAAASSATAFVPPRVKSHAAAGHGASAQLRHARPRTARAAAASTLRMAATPATAADSEHHQVLILGGGSAGVGVAAQLQNEGVTGLCILEPSDTHYYQPGWTFVGGGLFEVADTARPMGSVIPDGVRWVKGAAAEVLPEANQVKLATGQALSYDYLVVATGIQCDWARVAGLPEALAMRDGVCSNYHPQHAPATWEMAQKLSEEGGSAIFTQPVGPIKCGGAPQKAMWLTESFLRRQGTRDKADITFTVPIPKMFGVDKYNPVLNAEAAARDVRVLFETELVAVDGVKRLATFRRLKDGETFTEGFRMLHVTPPMSVPDFLKGGPLLSDKGFVDVDKATLQHREFPNVFALGDSADASALPTSKTLAAVTAMAPVVAHNLLRAMRGKRPSARYDGYSSCPIVLGYDKLLMTEFKYGPEYGPPPEPAETFTNLVPFGLLDQQKPNYFWFFVKQYVFPYVYFNLFPRGQWFGPKLLSKPDFTVADARAEELEAAA